MTGKGRAVMKRYLQLLRQPEFHTFVFCLMLLLMNWPFLAISGRNGLASIFIYLFVTWSILILLLFVIQRSLRGNASGEDGDKKGRG
jgi:hypothetical protein